MLMPVIQPALELHSLTLECRPWLAQAHKFLTGFAPVRAAVRLGAAAGALLAIPAEQLRRDGAAPRTGAAPLSRQIQRGLTGGSGLA